MAISKGNVIAATGNTANGGALASSTFDSTGAGLIVYGFIHEGAPTTYSISDNKSNTSWATPFEVDHTDGDMSIMVTWHKAPAVGTGHVITVTPGANRPYRYGLGVCVNGNFSGANIEAATPQTAQGTTGSPYDVDAGSLVTSAAAICLQFTANYNGYNSTPGTGWTEDSDTIGGRYLQSRVEASGGTFDPVHNIGNVADWASIALAFKEDAGGGGGSVANFLEGLFGMKLRGKL